MLTRDTPAKDWPDKAWEAWMLCWKILQLSDSRAGTRQKAMDAFLMGWNAHA